MIYVTRICHNESNWQFPTSSASEARNTFYSRHGYGHEEWLFRFEWQIGGWQYGFLQGVNKGWASRLSRGERVGDVVLFTITPNGRRYVAVIRELEFLDEAQGEAALAHYKRLGWYDRMLSEIDAVGGTRQGLGAAERAPNILNVRFRPESVDWFPPGSFADAEDPVLGYSRYQLIKLKLGPALRGTLNKRPTRKGLDLPPRQDSYYRRGSAGRDCSPEHTMMQAVLFEELKNEYPTGRITFEENFVDVAVVTDKEKIFFEIKSDYSVRKVLRLAVGQLLEYAYYWEGLLNKNVRLVAVGRVAPSAEDEQYLAYLTNVLNLPIEYRQVRLPSKP